jgi:hypothetical protein
MSRISRIAGAVTLLEGIAPLYVVFVGGDPFIYATSCVSFGCPSPTFGQSAEFQALMLGLGALMVADGAVGVWGARKAYLLGVVISCLFLCVAGTAYFFDNHAISSGQSILRYPAAVVADEVVFLVLSVLGIVFNLIALRTRGRLPEQANPMNLPVFG